MLGVTIQFDAEKYVRENWYPLALTDYSNIGLKLRCIDDRSSQTEGRGHDIAIPGGGLGLVMDALGALTLLKRNGKHVTASPQDVIEVVEYSIGPITFHTDEKSVKNRGVACGGCAHCSIALADPVAYLLSESDAQYFSEHGLLDLKEKLKLRGAKPAVYVGAHEAHAVITVCGTEVGLPSVGVTGEHVYVYHKDFHRLLLTLIAHELAALFGTHSKGISSDELEGTLHESAATRLGVTLKRLAVGLPQFVVCKKQTLSVAPLLSE